MFTKIFGPLSLPVQDTYYLLSDGRRYARHGTPDANGLLVFPTAERAEKFRRSVGAGLPEFETVEAPVADVARAGIGVGGFCVAEGLTVCVLSIAPDPSASVRRATRGGDE